MISLSDLIEPFAAFGFMRRALVGCLALSLGAAPVGAFLLLRRMSLTGDAMAHAILPGAAIGYLIAGLSLFALTLGGLVAGLAVALSAGAISRATPLREDASLASFYLISLALGVLIVSLRGGSVDLMHVLFGAVLAIDDDALILLAAIATITLLAFAAIYRALAVECFDPGFLRSVGGRGGAHHLAFLALAAINLVGAFHALGTLMAVGLMILPAAAARLWTDGAPALIVLAWLLGFASSGAGLLLSYYAELPAGPAIVLCAGAAYALSIAFGRNGGALRRWMPAPHFES